ncbi:PfkB family carbohydrate kinase [Eubacteriales bacterium OttesenSCG-928-N13]|nr:PfkB family carbohydrate kinase [Eubacteriales bacterium OttesenSCG-928-N13]
MKRALVVMDLSSVGRCALSVAVPVLSCMGVQACALPTMLLSAHTGGFGQVAKLDTSAFMRDAMAHWKAQQLTFDAIYIGYLGNAGQIELCAQLMDQSPDAFVLLDPVMADHGKLYAGIEQSRPQALRQLIQRADLIVPNQTEAQLLADGESPEALLALGTKAALVTGAGDRNLYLDQAGASFEVPFERVPQGYPGTGDLFASVLLGALMCGQPIKEATTLATDFVQRATQFSYDGALPVREGVRFEPLLHLLH